MRRFGGFAEASWVCGGTMLGGFAEERRKLAEERRKREEERRKREEERWVCGGLVGFVDEN